MGNGREKHTGEYLKVPSKVGWQLATMTCLIAGIIGLLLLTGGVAAALIGYVESLDAILTGVFLSLALIPGLFRSGVELDPEGKRFREYNGTLGRSKEAWIDVEKDDYLSIVGFSETRGTAGFGRIPRNNKMTMAMSKVYFWSGDWHLEVFKGYYEDASEFAEKFAGEYGLSINDVNKDQDLPGASQSSYNGAY